MKCPRCGAEVSAQKKCSKCGLNAPDNREELRVEYKDFKTSELLEISHKKQTKAPVAETIILREKPREEDIKGGAPAEISLGAKKSSFPLLTVVVLVIALIIGGLFLVHILLQQ